MEEETKPKRRVSRNSMRNMKQYKDMTDAEFNALYVQAVFGRERDEILEARFNRLMTQFEDEYDLSELLPNDRVVLRNLINSMLMLEDYDTQLRTLSLDIETTANNIITVEKLNNVCDKLRSAISNMQGDLGITRKSRKNDKEQSVLSAIEDLKKKANQFYEQKMQYIVCEKCGTLLATVWWINPQESKDKITVRCTRKLDDEQPCNWQKTYTAKELLDMGGSNKLEVLPESIR